MERAETYIVCAAAFQTDKIADHVDDVGGVEDALYGFAVDFLHSVAKIRISRKQSQINLSFAEREYIE